MATQAGQQDKYEYHVINSVFLLQPQLPFPFKWEISKPPQSGPEIVSSSLVRYLARLFKDGTQAANKLILILSVLPQLYCMIGFLPFHFSCYSYNKSGLSYFSENGFGRGPSPFATPRSHCLYNQSQHFLHKRPPPPATLLIREGASKRREEERSETVSTLCAVRSQPIPKGRKKATPATERGLITWQRIVSSKFMEKCWLLFHFHAMKCIRVP